MPTKQKQQKTPSFTAFMASQGPAMCAEERFSTIPTDLEKEAAHL
jgi:hypothetical protein